MIRIVALASLILLLAGCAASDTRSEQASRQAALIAAGKLPLIVVTVRNSRAASIRAGSTMRDYDLSPAYDASPRARADVDAIARRYDLQLLDAWPIEVLDVHCVVFATSETVDVNQLLARLQQDRRVESAQPLNTFTALAVTSQDKEARNDNYSDPYFELQENLQVLQVPLVQRVTRGAGVRIAVIDTGIDASHPDLAGRVRVQRNFVGRSKLRDVPERHGTAVAGVIAAIDNNGQGIVGIAPAAQLLSLRACWQVAEKETKAVCNTFTLAQALSAAIDLRADVVNLSLGGPADPLLDRLIAVGVQRGVVYVGATPPRADASVRYFPSDTPGVIGVASVEDAIQLAGSRALRAPGANVLTLTPAGGYDFMSGSSLAAASVSAGVALLLAHRGVESKNIYGALANSAHDSKSVDLCLALSTIDRSARCAYE